MGCDGCEALTFVSRIQLQLPDDQMMTCAKPEDAKRAARCRLLQATLPNLAALQELRVFSAGCVGGEQLAQLPGLLRAPGGGVGCALRELALSFAPTEGFAVADLDPLGGYVQQHLLLLCHISQIPCVARQHAYVQQHLLLCHISRSSCVVRQRALGLRSGAFG